MPMQGRKGENSTAYVVMTRWEYPFVEHVGKIITSLDKNVPMWKFFSAEFVWLIQFILSWDFSEMKNCHFVKAN